MKEPESAAALPPLAGFELPPRMRGRPFGAGPDGKPLNRTKGVIVRTTVETMLDCVGERAGRDLPADAPASERAQRVAEARRVALAELVERLNAAIGDPRYAVTAESLLDDGNSYAVELDLYLSDLCRLLSGHDDFHFLRGLRAVPASIAVLARPFSVSRVFELIPKFATRFADTEMRSLGGGSSTARIAWRGEKDVATLPEPLRPAFLGVACPWLRGVLASIPEKLAGLPRAEVTEHRCQLRGDAWCEYDVRWVRPRPRLGLELWLPAAAAAGLVLYAHAHPAFTEVAVPAALVLAVAGAALSRMKVLAFERDEKTQLLLETRQRAEEQADALQRANALLQTANVEQRERLGELTTLHDLGLALRGTLDVAELLDTSIRVVTTHLGFDRALVLLADDERRELRGGRMTGVASRVSEAVSQIRLPLDAPDPLLAPVLATGRPARVRADDPRCGKILRKVLSAVSCPEFFAVPLVAKDRVVGLLLVDNAETGRPLPDGIEPLLQTAGTLVASALDAALLHRTLEERVAERTRELSHANEALERSRDDLLESQRRLEAARDAAEQASRAKSAFLATMSHEIRTPMNGVLGMARLLLDTPLTPQQRSFAGTIRSSGDALLTIINDILDFSKIEAERMELESRPFGLRRLVSTVLDLFSPRAAEKGIALVASVGETVPDAFVGDPARLQQVLVNLVGNALKFTERGEVEVAALHEPPFLRFSVRDTGIGIPEDRKDRLFRPFSQVDSSTARRFGGTGLGLAISHRLTELMGGRMWVESEPGKGSTFSFTVSASPTEAPVTPPCGLVRPAPDEFEAGLGARHPLRLLLVEDNEVNQQLAVLILERLGYRADVAANGLEALEALRKRPYDVVLMDVQMPEMDGLTATRRVRSDFPRELQPRVVAMTANAMESDREECRQAGMDAFVSKPIDVRELAAALKEAVPLPAAPPPPARGDTLDAAALERLRASLGKQAGAMLPSLLARFLADAERLQAEARRALDAGDLAVLRRAAHTLKSNAASFGAKRLSSLCQALEAQAKAGTVSDGERELDGIAAAFGEVREALSATPLGAVAADGPART